jgi:protein-disulfide isomerase
MLTPPVSRKRDHAVGADRAAITLVEFGDYECPFCGQAHSILKDAFRQMEADVLFVFRNFPLTQVHPRALPAALASEAAGAQGAFWPMHDTLFENQRALKDDDLTRYADDLGLDVDRFVTDLEDDIFLRKVRADFSSGARSGVNGTPTFFVDGERFDGDWANGGLVALLNRLIRTRAQGLGDAPTP